MNGTYSLFVHRAVTFYSGGHTFIDVFNPPRRVTYFINLLTRGCTPRVFSDEEELEVIEQEWIIGSFTVYYQSKRKQRMISFGTK